jgi:hypothetical protein
MEERDYKRAIEWSETALRMDPTCVTALNTRGLSRIALGQWKDGWRDCRAQIGGKFRKRLQFLDEGMWDGKPGTNLVIYGEQGLGDEIMYASCVPDAARENTVVLECDRRLEGLFRRSFPQIAVYGTRLAKEIEWPNSHKIDANIPCGQLPEFYRPTPDSCPGTPYLVADPERRIQWRALFDSWGPKPKIGIAWSGGSKHNNPEARSAGIDAFRPLIQAIDADWISLQYKGDTLREIEEAGLPVKHYKRASEVGGLRRRRSASGRTGSLHRCAYERTPSRWCVGRAVHRVHQRKEQLELPARAAQVPLVSNDHAIPPEAGRDVDSDYGATSK